MPRRSKLPRTMQRLSPYRSPRKRKAFINSYERFHAKCVNRIQHIGGVEITLRKHCSLEALDLAVGAPHYSKMWEKTIKLQISRSLPPFCGEYFTTEAVLPESTMLGTIFRKMLKVLVERYSAYKRRRKTFNDCVYRVLEKHILGLATFEFSQRDVLIRNYLKIVSLLKIFSDEKYEEMFAGVFRVILRTLCIDYPEEHLLAMEMLRVMCADDDLKLSVFMEVEDPGTLEYLLCCARKEGFDFWGLWRGVGRLSARFNPVAVMFGCGKHVLARTLLNNGFQYSNVGTVYDDRCRCLSVYSYRDIPIISPRNIESLISKGPRDRMLLLLDILITFGEFDNPCVMPERVSTLVRISRSLPDSYITPMELFNSLGGHLDLTFLPKLIKICKKYCSAEVYDDDCRVSRPRRLVHLSRCAIRAALAAQFQLPHGIDCLELEERFKAYLSLDS